MALSVSGIGSTHAIGGAAAGEEKHSCQGEDGKEYCQGLSVFERDELVHIDGVFERMINNWIT